MTETGAYPGLNSAVRAVWWSILLRGVFAVIFGIVAWVWPGITVLALVYLFGIYALIDGVIAVAHGIKVRGTGSRWGWQIVDGVISIAAGIVAFAWPGVTALVGLLLIAAWAVVIGISEIVGAFQLKKVGYSDWGWTLASGILSVIFGIVLFASPAVGLRSLIWLVGLFAVVFGIVTIIAALRAHSAVKQL